MADLGVDGKSGFWSGALVAPSDVVADGGVLLGVGAVAFICRTMLDRTDAASATIDAVSARIANEIQPFQNVVARLDTIPGVNVRTAQVILAEIRHRHEPFPNPRSPRVLDGDVSRQPRIRW